MNLQVHQARVPNDQEFSELVDVALKDGSGVGEIETYLASETKLPKNRAGELEVAYGTDYLTELAVREIGDLEEGLPKRKELVRAVRQNNPTLESFSPLDKALSSMREIELLKANKKAFERVDGERKTRLVGPVSDIFSEAQRLEPANFGPSSEKVIDSLLESYLLIQGEMSIKLPQEELLKKSLTYSEKPKEKEFKELFSQNEAIERIEDKVPEIGISIRQLILRFINEQDFSEIVEKSDNLKRILETLVGEIITQEANKEMIKIWSEKDNYSLDNLNLATKEILEAEIRKYDLLGDFLEAFMVEKEVIELEKAGGLGLERIIDSKKTHHVENLLAPVSEMGLAQGYPSLVNRLEEVNHEINTTRTNRGIILNAQRLLERKQ